MPSEKTNLDNRKNGCGGFGAAFWRSMLRHYNGDPAATNLGDFGAETLLDYVGDEAF